MTAIHTIARWLRVLLRSYGTRLYLFVVGTLLGVVVVLTVISAREQGRLLEEHIRREGAALADFLTREVRLGVLSGNQSLVGEAVQSMLGRPGVEEVSVFDVDRQLLAQGRRPSVVHEDDNTTVPPHAGSGTVVVERDTCLVFWAPVLVGDSYQSEDALYFGGASARGLRVEGLVALTISKQSLVQGLRALTRRAVGVGALLLGVAALLTVVVVRQASRPLAQLLRKAQEIGVPVMAAGDDIGAVSDTFGHLVGALQEALSQIAALTEGLEKKVLERTGELEKANAELREARDHLEAKVQERTAAVENTHRQLLHAEKLAAVGRLSASFAHEINNPIFGIRNVLRGLQAPGAVGEHDATLVQMAIGECDRVATLIRALQGFYRPSSGVAAPVDLNLLLCDVLLLFRDEMKKRGVRLERQLAPELPRVRGVADQLKQVILNLLSNALDAMPEGGTVRVVSGTEAASVFIAVHDTGHGIPPEDLGRIFEPFFSTKPEVKGTGLGLSISYGIVKSHKGEIEVESRAGEGSAFTVWFPQAREEAP